jgi:hypothetical protein
MGRSPVEVTLDAADATDDLSGVKWPVLASDVEDTRRNVALARAWLGVVDQVGWPTGKG